MSENKQGLNSENKEQPKISWILVAFFAVAVFVAFVVLGSIALNLLNIRNIVGEYIVIFFVGSGIGYTIYQYWKNIRLFLSPPRTPEDKKTDKYGFARNAFLWGSLAICADLFILLFYRGSLDCIKWLADINTLTWSTAAATKISIGVFAVFAFIVTVWRGNLHSAQVDSQIKQLEQGNRQLRETENNNIAKLLVDGTKLLGKDTTEAEKIAGIACLANIIEGNSSFAEQATDIVHSFIRQRTGSTNNIIDGKDNVINAALLAIATYSIVKKKEFNFDSVKFDEVDFHKIKIFSQYFINATYEDCMFMNADVTFRSCKFRNCEFYLCKISDCRYIYNNWFNDCLWLTISSFGIRRNLHEAAKQDQIQDCYYANRLSPELFNGYSFRPFWERPENAQPIGYQKIT